MTLNTTWPTLSAVVALAIAAPLAACVPEPTPLAGADIVSGIDVRELVVGANHVYWSDFEGRVRRVPKTGGATQDIFDQTFGSTRIEADAGFAYFQNTQTDEVFRVEDSGTTMRVATGVGGLEWVVADDAVYELGVLGTITRHVGTEETVLLDGDLCNGGTCAFDAIATNGENLVYVDNMAGEILLLDIQGGSPSVFATETDPVQVLAVTGGQVAWMHGAEQGTAQVSRKFFSVVEDIGEPIASSDHRALVGVPGNGERRTAFFYIEDGATSAAVVRYDNELRRIELPAQPIAVAVDDDAIYVAVSRGTSDAILRVARR